VVTVAGDASRAARAFELAATAALTASGIAVRDLGVAPLPVARFDTASSDAAGGMVLRTSAGDPQSIDVVLLDARGGDLSAAARRRLERVLGRQEFRRAFPGEIAELSFPARTVESYVHELLGAVDVRGVAGAGLRVVLDTAGGTAALVVPALLGRLGVEVLTVNGGLAEGASRGSEERELARLGELVAGSGAAFGVRFAPMADRISLVDELGSPVSDGRALLVLLDLVAAERRGGRIALPVTTTRVAEQVTRFHGTQIEWTSTSPEELTRAASGHGVVFGGDGRGGFVLPEFSLGIDGLAAFVRLLGLVARTRLTVSQIDARIPRGHVLHRSIPTAWAVKGVVMRTVHEAAGGREVDTTDGVRVVEPDGRWALVLPDPAQALTHLWAEGPDEESAECLLESWARTVTGCAEAAAKDRRDPMSLR
jgi:mannose-1-phosphate guanylyltransferase/phosphomannomutase